MKKILLFILIGAISLSGCNDWLEVTPKSQVRADKMFDTYKGFRDALTACYVQMNDRTLYGEYLTMSAIESMAQSWVLDYAYYYPVYYPLGEFDYEDDNAKTAIKSIYGGLYNIVVQANTVLENIPTKGDVIADPATRAVIEGEALAIRAFCHLDILRIFGQMPQGATKTVMLPYLEKVSREAVPYYSYEDYKIKLETDLTNAEKLLESNDPLFTYSFDELGADSKVMDDKFLLLRQFRFNYYALKALQARYYLYTEQAGKAYAAAKTVLDATNADGTKIISLAGQDDYDNGGYALPSECLMALSNYDLQYYVLGLLGGQTGTFIDNSTLAINNDRYASLFAGFETSLRYTHTWNSSTVYYQDATLRPSIRKYLPVSGKSEMSNQIIPILRLSEVYLIAMESGGLDEANRLWPEYLAARNVLSSALFDSPEALKSELVREYRREFYAEGQMFFTYKRYGMSSMFDLAGDVTEDNYIVPLPDTEYNPNL